MNPTCSAKKNRIYNGLFEPSVICNKTLSYFHLYPRRLFKDGKLPNGNVHGVDPANAI